MTDRDPHPTPPHPDIDLLPMPEFPEFANPNRAAALDLAVQLEVARIRSGYGADDYDHHVTIQVDADALLAWLEAGDD